MTGNILKDFLVALGFKVDEATHRKFNESLSNATKRALELGAAVEGAAAAVEAAATRIASGLEDIYFMSQRTHQSATNINAFSYAVSQLGGSADDAKASLEGISNFIKHSPGWAAFFATRGVDPAKVAAGNLDQLADRWRGMVAAGHQAQMYFEAQFVGVNERTVEAMLKGTAKFEDEYRATLKTLGLDQEKATKQGHEFMLGLRQIEDVIKAIATKVGVGLLSTIAPQLERLKTFFADPERVQRFSQRLEDVLGLLIRLADFIGSTVVTVLTSLFDALEKLDQMTGGWSTKILAVVAALKVLGLLELVLSPVTAAILAMGAAIVALSADYDNWKAGKEHFVDWDKWDPDIKAAIQGIKDLGAEIRVLAELFNGALPDGLKRFDGAFTGPLDKLNTLLNTLTAIVNLLTGQWDKAWDAASKALERTTTGRLLRLMGVGGAPGATQATPGASETRPSPSPGVTPSAPSEAPTGAGDRTSAALAFFHQAGWSAQQAAGIVANLLGESQLNPRAVGDNGQAVGIAQWHPDRQAAFKSWAGKSLGEANFAEQLAFVQQELTEGAFKHVGAALHNVATEGGAAKLLTSRYEIPADIFGDGARRAAQASQLMSGRYLGDENRRSGPVSIVNNNTFHAHGHDDRAIVAGIGSELRGVASQQIRQLKGSQR